MKKIRTTHDMVIPGWGKLPAGTELKVIRHNSRYVYAELGKCTLRLSRIKDCQKVY